MIFLDTDFLVSFFIEKEYNHQRAVEIAETIQNEEKLISKLVIAETITLMKQKIPTKDIIRIYEILQDFTTIDDTYLFDKGFKQFIKYDSNISFFDSVYIAIMQEFDIYKIATFDKDFDNKDKIIRIH
ncbi:MAG: type II toxin-antitoxin system VapC family toxin [Methanobrevibacter arboriphilus]|uniref:Type II toxin-antitoxin system VapC family toxin n=1 Tax=Methanobrevibacter arboriphilus TaxID=39441 RepID=A0A843AK32_METAZ|nr:type II toxin-antitoxin system VapC family toxin [Methanobrevibacter arboriphilus]MBF4467898.1 type II toxin-antitoxin system VapC family toxin [Methanobrevibacter arboriphilus]